VVAWKEEDGENNETFVKFNIMRGKYLVKVY
jgi:hypothetical protein